MLNEAKNLYNIKWVLPRSFASLWMTHYIYAVYITPLSESLLFMRLFLLL